MTATGKAVSAAVCLALCTLVIWLPAEETHIWFPFNPLLINKEDTFVNNSKDQPPVQMYSRLLSLASNALDEKNFKHERLGLWEEPYQQQASKWKPCADKTPRISSDIVTEICENPPQIVEAVKCAPKYQYDFAPKKSRGKPNKSNGYITVSANGGLNQQRVAICNAVAVASLLNATLVLPKFLYSNVWKDPSQFADIYDEDYFINSFKEEVGIVKELPPHLKVIDTKAIGSQITDSDLEKEATPSDYLKIALPPLLRNGVIHFLGFANRLGFDPVPPNLQLLRCKCNFHALKFVPKIEHTGSLLVSKIRKHNAKGSSRYLALHLRFEVDMLAFSMCDFGGGESEKKELEAYRKSHFPRLKISKYVSPAELRKLGNCPLTPEEAALVLAALGFASETYIYLAGSNLYGGNSRMHPFNHLYPNLVTKETILAPSELAPFRNFSSQMAALDFIACAKSDVFAMTESGSQFAYMVSGFRSYYGHGNAPSLCPNKAKLAAILSENATITWNSFKNRVRKMIQETQRVGRRGRGRSIYRQPRSPECMCKSP